MRGLLRCSLLALLSIAVAAALQPRPASAHECPVIITALKLHSPIMDEFPQDLPPGYYVLTTFYRANSLRYAHYDATYIFQDGTRQTINSEAPDLTGAPKDAYSYGYALPVGFNVREHGLPVAAWISHVIDTDGKRISCSPEDLNLLTGYSTVPDIILQSRASLMPPNRRERENNQYAAMEVKKPIFDKDDKELARIGIPHSKPMLADKSAKQPATRVAQGKGAEPECATPNKEAEINGTGPTLEYPDSARELGATGLSIVKVTLDSTGAVVDATIFTSSGNDALDASALKAAKATTYIPEIVNCRPKSGSYLFKANFGISNN